MKAFCFDMDGLLVDSEGVAGKYQIQALQKQGLFMTAGDQVQFMGLTMKSTKERITDIYHEKVDADIYEKDWIDLMVEASKHGIIKPMRGANRTLNELKGKGIKTALCTSNLPALVDNYLDLFGWRNMFDCVIMGTMVQNGKPAPDIYLKGAQVLEVKPQDCVGVQDSINGIKAVRAAGMYSVMIPDHTPYTPNLAQYVDMCAEHLDQMMDRIFRK